MSNKKTWRSFVISEQVKLDQIENIFDVLSSDQRIRLTADLQLLLSESEEKKLHNLIKKANIQGEIDLLHDDGKGYLVCKGSILLGSACMKCEKCKIELQYNKKLKLYEGTTGDLSVIVYAWDYSKKQAIERMNNYYEENYQDEDGFVFDKESVSKVKKPKAAGVFQSYSAVF